MLDCGAGGGGGGGEYVRDFIKCLLSLIVRVYII